MYTPHVYTEEFINVCKVLCKTINLIPQIEVDGSYYIYNIRSSSLLVNNIIFRCEKVKQLLFIQHAIDIRYSNITDIYDHCRLEVRSNNTNGVTFSLDFFYKCNEEQVEEYQDIIENLSLRVSDNIKSNLNNKAFIDIFGLNTKNLDLTCL